MAEAYGPPGYGEDPQNDAKEKFYYLILENKVSFLQNINEINTPETDIRELQLVIFAKFRRRAFTLSNQSFSKLLKKRIAHAQCSPKVVFRTRDKRMQGLQADRNTRALEQRQVIIETITDAKTGSRLDPVCLVMDAPEPCGALCHEAVIPDGFFEHEHPAADQMLPTRRHRKALRLDEGMVERHGQLTLAESTADFHVVKQAARGWAITPTELQLEMKTAAHRQSRGCILACRLSKNKILHHKDNQAENL